MSTRDPLLTTKQVAAILNVSPATLAQWRYRGDPTPPAIKMGGALRYSRADLDAWIEARREQDTYTASA